MRAAENISKKTFANTIPFPDQPFAAIAGFESVLTEDFNNDDYRLTIIYYQASQADVQLRAVIEDVLPSTVGKLAEYMPHVADEAAKIKRKIAVTETDYTAENYRSFIYPLIRAYGGGYNNELSKFTLPLLHIF